MKKFNLERFLRSTTLATAALTLATLSASAAGSKAMTVNGWISDSQCGAGHGSKGPDRACVAKCIKEGAKPVFVDDAKNQVWTIDDPDVVTGHYGHHVAATLNIDEEKKVVHISKVAMLPDQGPKTGSMDMDHK